MRRLLDAGGRHAAVEFTSEALALGAARSWPCRVGVFTNLSHDHLDAHSSPEHYLASKAQLFMALSAGGSAILNGCDSNAALLEEVVPAGVERIRYGVASRGEPWAELDLAAHSVAVSWAGTKLALTASSRFDRVPPELTLRAIGDVYAENALAALAAALVSGVPPQATARALADCPAVAGRFERVSESPNVVIDYAHSPDALTRTLCIARSLCRARLTLVFGAGGDRDRDKRPLLGAAAAAADRVVLTSDNPRSEDPHEIAAAIRAGLGAHPAVDEELDRARAIELAIHDAGPDDLVLVAGKGHERTQSIVGESREFSDRDVIRSISGERARDLTR
jgi:UDP-N-acetylmuramoyl-L-alanyl-D-glutamate--2,6-diaminopimelate ligase